MQTIYEKVHKLMGARMLKIPEDIVAALRIPPNEMEDELHKELALALYQRGMLSYRLRIHRRFPHSAG